MVLWPKGGKLKVMTPDEAEKYMEELREAEKGYDYNSKRKETNTRFSGDYYVVDLATGEPVESHEYEENALHAALVLNSHEINNGRIPIYQVLTKKQLAYTSTW